MIILTGDLHHASLGTDNQRYCDDTEIQVARRYLERIADAGVHVTFFVTGKSFEQEWDDLRFIAEHPLVELGGHNYDCFQPVWAHRTYNALTGSYNGPARWQRRDARRTIEAARARTGRRLRLWRNHMYMHGPHTERVLADRGIELCADGVDPRTERPLWHPAGLFNYPLNIIPDHEHLYHAERTPAWVRRWQRRHRWSDAYGPHSYPAEAWAEIVLDGIRRREACGVVSHLLIHPITMELADEGRSFDRILAEIASRESAHLGTVLDAARRRRLAAREEAS